MARLSVDLPNSDVVPLAGLFGAYKGKEDPDFLDTMKPIAEADVIPGLMEAAEKRKKQAEEPIWEEDTLPANNRSCILMYCAEDSSPTLYTELHNRSFSKDRRLIKPFLDFMWLLIKTLELLPPCEDPTTVHRVCQGDLKADYPVGKEFTWHGFASTSRDYHYGEPEYFEYEEAEGDGEGDGEGEGEGEGEGNGQGDGQGECEGLGEGEGGGVRKRKRKPRTIFRIELTQKQARNISSYTQDHHEVLLPPGCRFKVLDVYEGDGEGGSTIIRLHEVRSLAWVLDLGGMISDGTKEIIDIFGKFDLDKNQRISREELTSVMVDIGMKESEADTLITLADKDKSGDLDFTEFVGWIFSGSDMVKQVKDRIDPLQPNYMEGGDQSPIRATPSTENVGKDLQTVAVNTLAGDSHEVKVPLGVKASELRASIAELVGIPKIEIGLLDNDSGSPIFFGAPTPMETIPASVTLIRNRKWVGVPQGMHHPHLDVSEDRCRVGNPRQYENAGCYLTAPLDRGGRYVIDFDLEMDYSYHCIWLGVTSDRMTKWDYLKGAFFSTASGYWRTVWDCFFQPTHPYGGPEGNPKIKTYNTEKIDEILNGSNPKKLRMVVDSRNGGMELKTQEDEMIVEYSEPEFLVEDALRICCAFLEPGAVIAVTDCRAE